MVTINEIARQAGVSRGTVDRVLNNRKKVSPEKEALVRRIAEELGYQPSAAGRGLAVAKKKLQLGFLYPESEQAPFFRKLCQGARKYADSLRQYGVTVHYFPWNFQTLEEEDWAETLLGDYPGMHGWAADGIAAKLLFDAAEKSGRDRPLVVTYNVRAQGYPCLAHVGCDYRMAGRLACGIAALMTAEKGRVCVVSLDPGIAESYCDRVEGFEQEMREAYPQMKIVGREIMDGGKEVSVLYRNVLRMLEQHPEIEVLYLVNPGDYGICNAIRRARAENPVRIITNDLVSPEQIEMVRQGQIAATICQEPEVQGAKPLEILFRYLAFGTKPASDWHRTELSIRLRQNI